MLFNILTASLSPTIGELKLLIPLDTNFRLLTLTVDTNIITVLIIYISPVELDYQ